MVVARSGLGQHVRDRALGADPVAAGDGHGQGRGLVRAGGRRLALRAPDPLPRRDPLPGVAAVGVSAARVGAGDGGHVGVVPEHVHAPAGAELPARGRHPRRLAPHPGRRPPAVVADPPDLALGDGARDVAARHRPRLPGPRRSGARPCAPTARPGAGSGDPAAQRGRRRLHPGGARALRAAGPGPGPGPLLLGVGSTEPPLLLLDRARGGPGGRRRQPGPGSAPAVARCPARRCVCRLQPLVVANGSRGRRHGRAGGLGAVRPEESRPGPSGSGRAHARARRCGRRAGTPGRVRPVHVQGSPRAARLARHVDARPAVRHEGRRRLGPGRLPDLALSPARRAHARVRRLVHGGGAAAQHRHPGRLPRMAGRAPHHRMHGGRRAAQRPGWPRP